LQESAKIVSIANYVSSNALNTILLSHVKNNNFGFIPNGYDSSNNYYYYDLDLTKYILPIIETDSTNNMYKVRTFRITTWTENKIWDDYCNNETVTFYMNNWDSNNNRSDDNIANTKVIGRLTNNITGYWYGIPNNFNYIRFIAKTSNIYFGSIEPINEGIKTISAVNDINFNNYYISSNIFNKFLNNINLNISTSNLILSNSHSIKYTNSNISYNVPSYSTQSFNIGTSNIINIVGASVGIGTKHPLANLHVEGTVYCSSSSTWQTGCDVRIKKNITEIQDNFALSKILKINPVIYDFIDSNIQKTNNYGFIAQNIKEIIPEAITYHKNFIPNIYETVSYNINNNTLILNKEISDNININDNLRIISNDENIDVKVVEISDNKITIEDNTINNSNVFIYGTEINDFHSINKDLIYTLNIKATQDLYKLVNTLQKRIEELEKIIQDK